MNTFLFTAVVTAAPAELRKTPSGVSVIGFQASTVRRYANASGAQIEEAASVSIEAFGQLAEANAQVAAGAKVLVHGRVKPQRNWQSNGATVYSGVEITANSIMVLPLGDDLDDANIFIITGNLGRDPEMRYTPGGSAVTSFSVANTRRYNANGEQVEETTWVRADAFGKLAETCNQYLAKGRKVLIEGRIKPQRTWQKDDGSLGYSGIEVVATAVEFLSPRNGTEAADPAQEAVIPF
jgi:single-strand DNA-binding protein